MNSAAVPDLLEVAVRAYTEPRDPEKRIVGVAKRDERIARLLRKREVDNRRPVLIVDAETTTDSALALLFAVYRFCRWEGDQLVCVLEGLVGADKLPTGQRKVLGNYWRAHRLASAADQSLFDSAPALQLLSGQAFVCLLCAACFKV